jgi:CheY-like chemotaxis protein
MARALIGMCKGEMEVDPSDNSVLTGASERHDLLSIRIVVPFARQWTVLVIDDNEDALHLLKRYLVDTPYRFVGALDAQRGLELAKDKTPDLIVLDVMMPQTDGWTLLGALREHPTTRGIPLIVCTILTEKDLAYALGAADFIRKPVSRTELLSVLDRHLC